MDDAALVLGCLPTTQAVLDMLCRDLLQQIQLKDQLIQDADRRVADKQRAYNLLHADLVNQKAEAAEAVAAAAELHKQ